MSNLEFDFDLSRIEPPVHRQGQVTEIRGTVVRAAIPDVHLGEICRIERPDEPDLEAEVIGFDRQGVLLMPLGQLSSIRTQAVVKPGGGRPMVPCGEGVRGRVLDALGDPLDSVGPLRATEHTPLMSDPPNPLARDGITEPLPTGVRSIDALLTVGRGQRMGIFAAAGVGKSTLMSMIARNVAADTVVMALIGERGREVRGFLENDLGEAGLAKSTVVVSTSDQPALLRLRAAFTATAIAEAARRKGQRVVLLMDSVTRFARALREVGLAAGEPPGRQGYPASVFALLPRLFERAGNDVGGSITAFYTVLVTGDDLAEPVADETIGLLDGHIILSREIAARGQYPAIDILRSKSRLMTGLVDRPHLAAATRANQVVHAYEKNYDKITMGLYDPPEGDEEGRLVRMYPNVQEFLKQDQHDAPSFEETAAQLKQLCG
ncbi:MAG: FliI/YscN family ATPase [Planctomycetota bacterium]